MFCIKTFFDEFILFKIDKNLQTDIKKTISILKLFLLDYIFLLKNASLLIENSNNNNVKVHFDTKNFDVRKIEKMLKPKGISCLALLASNSEPVYSCCVYFIDLKFAVFNSILKYLERIFSKFTYF